MEYNAQREAVVYNNTSQTNKRIHHHSLPNPLYNCQIDRESREQHCQLQSIFFLSQTIHNIAILCLSPVKTLLFLTNKIHLSISAFSFCTSFFCHSPYNPWLLVAVFKKYLRNHCQRTQLLSSHQLHHGRKLKPNNKLSFVPILKSSVSFISKRILILPRIHLPIIFLLHRWMYLRFRACSSQEYILKVCKDQRAVPYTARNWCLQIHQN